MVNIIVACGGGIFTTTIVTDEIKQILRKKKIKHTITPSKITQIANVSGVDLIVCTGKTSTKNVNGIPILIGISLLTGKGAEEFTDELLQKIKEIEEGK